MFFVAECCTNHVGEEVVLCCLLLSVVATV